MEDIGATSTNISRRIAAHCVDKYKWFDECAFIDSERFDILDINMEDLLDIETSLIKAHKPIHNNRHTYRQKYYIRKYNKRYIRDRGYM